MQSKYLWLLLAGLLAIGTTYFLYERTKFAKYAAHAVPADNMNVPVNTAAPVFAGNEIQIDAPVTAVWAVLTDIDTWPSWQSNITEAELNGPLMAGSSFDWKADGLRFHSTLHTVGEPHYLGWTGTTWGAAAVHNWRLSPVGDTATLVRVEEHLQGVFPSLFSGSFQENLAEGMQQQLLELKTAAEGVANR